MSSADGEGNDQQPPPPEETPRKKPPYEPAELTIMAEGLQANREVLFGAKERKTPLRIKNKIWADIATRISAEGHSPRTGAEVKKRWQDLKIRVRKMLAQHRAAQRATGGGSVPELVLRPWEEACRAIIDDGSLEGVGDAESGAHQAEDEPGTSRQPPRPVAQPARKRRAVDPLPPLDSPPPATAAAGPRRPATTAPPATTGVCTPAPPATNTAGPPGAPAAQMPPDAAPRAWVSGVGHNADVTLTLLPVSPRPPTTSVPASHVLPPRQPRTAWVAQEVEVEDEEDEEDEEEAGVEEVEDEVGVGEAEPLGTPEARRPRAGTRAWVDQEERDAVLGEVLERLQQLEANSRNASVTDADLIGALRGQAAAATALVEALKAVTAGDVEGAVGGVQSELEGQRRASSDAERARRADAKQLRTIARGCMNAVSTLTTAVVALTDQVRQDSLSVVTAIGDLAVALRQSIPPPPVCIPLVPSSSSTPSRSTASAQASPATSPVRGRGLRRQRGGRRGAK